MICDRDERPLTLEQLQNWLIRLPVEEMTPQGWSADSLSKEAQVQKYIYFLQEERVSALILYHQTDPQTLEILYLSTCPEDRRKSAMDKLFREFLRRHKGCRIWLEVRAGNLAAQALYKKLGFQEVGRRSSYYRDGMDAILLNF